MAEVIRESAAAQVRRILSERILSGELAPGDRLRELHIAAEFKLSQGPVREAFRELETMGLVHTEPYKGTTVREVTKADIRDAYIVRAALEDLAGRFAASSLKGNVEHLRKMALEIRKAATANDVARYVRFDVAFHRAIVEAAQNQVLLRAWDALGFETRMQIRLVNSTVNLVEVQKQHWPIIDALEQGQGRKAGKLLQEHVYQFSRH